MATSRERPSALRTGGRRGKRASRTHHAVRELHGQAVLVDSDLLHVVAALDPDLLLGDEVLDDHVRHEVPTEKGWGPVRRARQMRRQLRQSRQLRELLGGGVLECSTCRRSGPGRGRGRWRR